MPEITTETRELIAQFKQQQAEAEAKRAANRPNRSTKREINLERLSKRRNMTAREVEGHAHQWGFTTRHGGREGTYLVAPDGYEIPLTMHPSKSLATGTQRHVMKRIQEHGISPN